MKPRPRLLIGTGNPGKLRELSALLADVPYELVSLDNVGVDCDVDETGSTLEENAVLKATTYARMTGLTTLADDSGLEVDAIDGAPGVRSSRYAGEGATDGGRIAYLLEKLDNIRGDDLTARFRCVMALARPGGRFETYSGLCEGAISRSPKGTNGFGYDPIFIVRGYDRTMAELSDVEKNEVSHRARAAVKAAAALTAGEREW